MDDGRSEGDEPSLDESEEATYTNLLVARHSPVNKCFAEEGEPLWLGAEPNRPLKMHRMARHPFRGVRSRRKSQFGWVWPTSPFTWSEFAENHLKGATETDRQATRRMLRAVQGTEVGQAFAAHFYWRVFPHRQHVLTVHRVILADEAP